MTWTYSYANLRPNYLPSGALSISNPWAYDSVTVDGPNGYHNVYGVATVNQGA